MTTRESPHSPPPDRARCLGNAAAYDGDAARADTPEEMRRALGWAAWWRAEAGEPADDAPMAYVVEVGP